MDLCGNQDWSLDGSENAPAQAEEGRMGAARWVDLRRRSSEPSDQSLVRLMFISFSYMF